MPKPNLTRKDWIRPKGYVHVSKKYFEGPSDRKFIHSYVTNKENIKNHSFYPFIHVRIKNRRFKKSKDNVDGKILVKKCHAYRDENGDKKSNIKTRKIYYAAHIDSQIYSYYAIEILGKKYEDKLKNNPELSNSICAYRRIPTHKNSIKNKCNIHFANEAFEFIKDKLNKTNSCVAITMDITEFFDSLDHTLLYEEWKDLIQDKNLPEDHYNIYRSLTNFSYIDLKDLLKLNKCNHINDLKRNGINAFFKGRRELRESIKKHRFLKHHPFKKDGKLKGIPQGTAISAFLANLYLSKFDEFIFQQVKSIGGLYRRYSDDIIVVCDPKDCTVIQDILIHEIKKYHLVIQPEKTQTFHFENLSNNITMYEVNGNEKKIGSPLKYLGFEFDGKNTRLKSSSLSKFYRQMIVHVKVKAILASKEMKKNTSVYASGRKSIYLSQIYKLYSHLGKHEKKKRNFFIYAKEAAKIMSSDAINKQLKNSWRNLNIIINKHVHRRKLNEINKENYLIKQSHNYTNN